MLTRKGGKPFLTKYFYEKPHNMQLVNILVLRVNLENLLPYAKKKM